MNALEDTSLYEHDLADVVIYARYSSDKQNEQSIDGQLRYCYEFAAHHGFRVIGEYIDKALSGTNATARPEFQRMIVDSKKHVFKYVLVWKLDRFARNRYDSAIYKNELKRNGVRVLSVTEGVGNADESIILEAILEAMAEEYSRQLSQNVRRGLHESALKGNSVGGTIPLGYKLENKKLVIDEREADIVRYMFSEYASGKGKKQIVDELNDRGYRTRSGSKLIMSSFNRTLTNKKYIGVYHYNDEVEVDGGCPAIIDIDTFEKCARKIEIVKKSPAHNKARESEYILQGKMFCGHCGAPMVGESGKGKGGSVYHYYACAAKKKSHTCSKKNEKKDFIEWYVVEQTVEYVLTPDRLELIATRVVEEYNKDFNSGNVKVLEKELREINKEIDEVVDAIIKTTAQVVLVKLNEKAEALSARKEYAELELAKLKVASGIKITVEEVSAWLERFCTGDLMDEDFRHKIIDVFINSVYLYDDKVVIYYNLHDSKQVSYIEMLESTDDSAGVNCSDLECVGSPMPDLFEHCRYIFVNGVFGCVIYRNLE